MREDQTFLRDQLLSCENVIEQHAELVVLSFWRRWLLKGLNLFFILVSCLVVFVVARVRSYRH